MSDQNKKFKPLKSLALSVPLSESLEMPSWLRLEDFNLDRAQSFQINEQVYLTIIPPREVFDGKKVNLEQLMAQPCSWLIMRPDHFGTLYAQELEVSKESGKLKLRLVQGANRLVAEGIAAQEEGEGITFILQTVGRASKRAQVSFRGRLDARGYLQLESTLKARTKSKDRNFYSGVRND